MPTLALTCDCGARFDADDLIVGQELPCPECGEPIRAPERDLAPRTSQWALAALVLAMVGILTPVGGLLAVLVGLWALNVIRERSGKLSGNGIALAAIGLGLVSCVVGVGLGFKPNLVPVATWFRQRTLAGQIDTTGSLEMIDRSGSVLITRPSQDWGRARRDRTDDPVVGEIQQKLDLLLVNIKRHAYVDVYRDGVNATMTFDNFLMNNATFESGPLLMELNPYRTPLLGDESGFRRGGRFGGVGGATPDSGPFTPTVRTKRDLEPVDDHTAREWRIQQTRAGQKWEFIIRAYQKKGNPITVVRAYTPQSRFGKNEAELLLMLDTVRIP